MGDGTRCPIVTVQLAVRGEGEMDLAIRGARPHVQCTTEREGRCRNLDHSIDEGPSSRNGGVRRAGVHKNDLQGHTSLSADTAQTALDRRLLVPGSDDD